jgi:hypothetical protein
MAIVIAQFPNSLNRVHLYVCLFVKISPDQHWLLFLHPILSPPVTKGGLKEKRFLDLQRCNLELGRVKEKNKQFNLKNQQKVLFLKPNCIFILSQKQKKCFSCGELAFFTE